MLAQNSIESGYILDNSFQTAVTQFNTGNYSEVERVLNNLSYSEKELYAKEISFLAMRIKYSINNLNESMKMGKVFLQKYSNSNLIYDVHSILGDIFLANGQNESAFRTYINSYYSADY